MGEPVATVGSQHICPVCKVPGVIVQGESNTLINGKPVATIQSICNCGTQIVTGTANILVNGKPIASVGDLTSHGSTIISGSPNVIIDSGSSKPSAIKPIKDINFPEITFKNRIMNSKGVKEFEEKKKMIEALAEEISIIENKDLDKAKIKKVIWVNSDKKRLKLKKKIGFTKNLFFGQKVFVKLKGNKYSINKNVEITIRANKINGKHYEKKFTIKMFSKKEYSSEFLIEINWYNEEDEMYHDYGNTIGQDVHKAHQTSLNPKQAIEFSLEAKIIGTKDVVKCKENLIPTTYRRNYEELFGLRNLNFGKKSAGFTLLKKGEKITITPEHDKETNYENDFIKKYKQEFPEIETIVDNFTAFCENPKNQEIGKIRTEVIKSAKNLWNEAVKQNKKHLDDRPLYWARIKIQVILKRQYLFIKEILTLSRKKRNKFFNESIVPKNSKLEEIIQLFEIHSRNYEGIDFSNAGEEKKRLLILGFDPFGLYRNILQSNPSGLTALVLHNNQTVGDFYIQTFIVPNRYKDFDEFKDGQGVIEKYVTDFIKNKKVDIIITLSQGREFRFDIERFAGKNRGGKADNLNWAIKANSRYLKQINLKDANEFYETKLPYIEMVPKKNTNNKLYIYFRQTFSTKKNSKSFSKANREGYELIEDDKNTSHYKVLDLVNDKSVESDEGSGSSYLSNESFYRVSRIRENENPNIKTGHIHLPCTQSPTDNSTRTFKTTLDMSPYIDEEVKKTIELIRKIKLK